MSDDKKPIPSLGTLPRARRRPVGSSGADWVRMAPLSSRGPALRITPAVDGIDLVAWAENNRGMVHDELLEHGALLFRGFDLDEVSRFEELIARVSGGALEYTRRAGPRTRVSGNIYTSTDYPADQTIFPHNEGAFQPEFPLKLFFYCDVVPTEGGETPIGDNRWITSRIPDDVKGRFRRQGVMYVRNFGTGFGLDWRTAFQTDSKQEVEEYCREQSLGWDWYPAPDGSGECLRTRAIGPALVPHPETGEELWFNHATFFHVTTLPDSIREGLLAEFADDELPANSFYGDGSPIEADVLEMLRGLYRESLVDVAWQRRDVLMVDNLLMVHARRPYAGDRRIVVGLADQANWKDVWSGPEPFPGAMGDHAS